MEHLRPRKMIVITSSEFLHNAGPKDFTKCSHYQKPHCCLNCDCTFRKTDSFDLKTSKEIESIVFLDKIVSEAKILH